MAYNISLTIVYLFELLISFIFFGQISDYKYSKYKIFLIGLISFSIPLLLNISFSTIWLNFTSFFIANCIFSIICFNINLKQSVFYALVLDIVSTATEYITIFIVSVISQNDVAYTTEQYYTFLLNAFICKSLYFFLVLILSRLVKKNDTTRKIPLTFYLYPISIVGVLLFLWSIYTSFEISGTYKLLISFISALLLLSTIVLFISLKNTVEKELKISILEKEMIKLENDKIHYDILEKQNENLLIYAHDTKKHLTALSNLSDDSKINHYIEQMTETLNQYSNVVTSGNHTLDVILNKYVTECEIKGIKFTFDVRLSKLSYVDIYDLVTILGNVLDNAIEAAEKSQNKYIDLFTDYRNTYDIIIIKNSCDDIPTNIGNTLKTTKPKSSCHGLGIKSLTKTLYKYNGDFIWDYDYKKREFITTITLLQK